MNKHLRTYNKDGSLSKEALKELMALKIHNERLRNRSYDKLRFYIVGHNKDNLDTPIYGKVTPANFLQLFFDASYNFAYFDNYFLAFAYSLKLLSKVGDHEEV